MSAHQSSHITALSHATHTFSMKIFHFKSRFLLISFSTGVHNRLNESRVPVMCSVRVIQNKYVSIHVSNDDDEKKKKIGSVLPKIWRNKERRCVTQYYPTFSSVHWCPTSRGPRQWKWNGKKEVMIFATRARNDDDKNPNTYNENEE